MEANRKTTCALFVLICLCSFCCSGCGGGGSHDSSGNIGIGWIDFSFTGLDITEETSIELAGETFTNQDAECWGSLTGFLGPGYSVNWMNETTGISGEAYTVLYCFNIEYAYWRVFCGIIPLDLGDNLIRVTASDRYGNVGKNSITVTRVADLTAPTIVATSPKNDQTISGLTDRITVTFSEEMLGSSLNSDTFFLQDSLGNPVLGTVTYSDWGKRAVLTIGSQLDYGQTYSATLTTGVMDLAGSNPLETDIHWSFTTGLNPDTIPPTVTATSPVDGGYFDQEESNAISATFDESIQPSTVSSMSFILEDPEGNPVGGNIICFDNEVTFEPWNILAADQVYMATLTTLITDLEGNPLTGSYSWSFTVSP